MDKTKLTQEQIRYAGKRIKEICRDKVEQIRKELKEEEFGLSFEAKYKLISSGKATLKSFKAINIWTDLTDAYEYPGQDEVHRRNLINRNNNKKRVEAVEKEADILLDKLYLGDSKEVIELIEKFLNKKF